MPKIFITSYPYVYERYFRVFDYFQNKENLVFILPKKWKTRAGFIKPPERENIEIMKTRAFFYGSKTPIVRGLLKGWMPATNKMLKKYAKPGDVLYTAIEPNLLTTCMNARIAKKLGLKHIFFTWQNVPYRQRLSGMKLKITEWLIRRNVALSAGAICGNTKAAEILREYTPTDFKILTVPISGVDTERFRPDIKSDFREKYNLQNKTVLLFAGVFDERKGIDAILNAFSKVVPQMPPLHLVMVGMGPLKNWAEDFIKKAGLNKNITLINWLSNDDLPGYFANSDIFIHPSMPRGGWEEQFGYSIAEASVSGLPVISTDTGSIGEIILNGKTGVLIRPGDLKLLTDAITELATDKIKSRKMGLAGREHILSRYSHCVIADRMEIFLNNI